MSYIRQLLLVCVLSILAFQSQAQTVSLTAKNQGYYIVNVDGAKVSQHTQEREAIEAAVNQKLAQPSSIVEYTHAYTVSVAITGQATAPTATLQWDPPNVAVDGYKVYIGTAPGTYASGIDVGNITNYTVKGLQVGTLYYFAVTAYKGAVESEKSNEVSKAF